MSTREKPMSGTHVSLISRLKKDDRTGEAWVQFVDRYGGRLFTWCVARGLQTADAEDVTQNVLIKVAKHIHRFDYDESQTFRGWLRRITENAIVDYHRAEGRERHSDRVDDGWSILVNEQAREDLLDRLDSAFDLEIFELAMDRVRARIDDRRWLAWQWCAREGLASGVVAERLEMNIATVYSARHQIQKMIADEVAILERKQPPGLVH